MPGATPLVDTVIRRGLMPASAVSTRSDPSVAATFASGSPIPMKTMWVTGPMPRSWSTRDAARTWSTISAVVQLRRSPMCPVAQNGHPTAHPTWLLTQTVERRRESARAGVSIATVSMVWPSARRQRSLMVSPPSARISVSTLTVENSNSAASPSRSAAGSCRTDWKSATNGCQTAARIWRARQAGSPRRDRAWTTDSSSAVLKARVGISPWYGRPRLPPSTS